MLVGTCEDRGANVYSVRGSCCLYHVSKVVSKDQEDHTLLRDNDVYGEVSERVVYGLHLLRSVFDVCPSCCYYKAY